MISNVACLLGSGSNPYHNMAVEAHLCRMLRNDTAILYFWHASPCVELGCGLDYHRTCKPLSMKERNIFLTRRPGGGGGVYMDEGTLGYSFIVPRSEWNVSKQCGVLLRALGSLGLPMQPISPGLIALSSAAAPTVCQSYYLCGNIGLEHGSIHVGTNTNTASSVLRASCFIGNLTEIIPQINSNHVISSLYQAMEAEFGARAGWLNEDVFDEKEIDRLSEQYRSESWLFLPPIEDEWCLSRSFVWGNLTVGIQANKGCILQCRFRSNTMEAALLLELENLLVGVPCLNAAVTARFEQKVTQLNSPYLKRIVRETCGLVCERISRLEPDIPGRK